MSSDYERGYVEGHKAGTRLATRAAIAAGVDQTMALPPSEAANKLAIELADAVGFDPLVRLDANGTTIADIIQRHSSKWGR